MPHEIVLQHSATEADLCEKREVLAVLHVRLVEREVGAGAGAGGNCARLRFGTFGRLVSCIPRWTTWRRALPA